MTNRQWTTFTSDSPEWTEDFGRALAAVLAFGATVPLHGELGTGKTVLSRGIARGLGIREAVTSPTFTVAQEYDCGDGKWFFHLDMYRIRDEIDALHFGVEEYLFAPHAISVIEWPERIHGLLYERAPSHHANAGAGLVPVTLEHSGETTRTIRIDKTIADLMAL